MFHCLGQGQEGLLNVRQLRSCGGGERGGVCRFWDRVSHNGSEGGVSKVFVKDISQLAQLASISIEKLFAGIEGRLKDPSDLLGGWRYVRGRGNIGHGGGKRTRCVLP